MSKMQPKPDGRLYSKVLRRIVAAIQIIPKNNKMTLLQMSELIVNQKSQEFFLFGFDKYLSSSRVRDYLRYMRDVKVLVQQDDQYRIDFEKKDTDAEWAQALSDRAKSHIFSILKLKSADDVPIVLRRSRERILQQKKIPTVDSIITLFGIEGGRSKELFRWSLYVYTDGESCPFDIKRNPYFSDAKEDKHV